MTQITRALRKVPQSERFFHWQATVAAAFAGGSLTAALLNLGAAMALSFARAALGHTAAAGERSDCHA